MPSARTATIKDVLLLRSDHFSFESPFENGVQYDCPLGDDLAAFLKGAIESRDASWRILDPIREDYGTELLCYRDGKCFQVTVNWIPLGGAGLRRTEEEVWVLHFRQSHGCLGSLLRVRDDRAGLATLRGLVADIVTAEQIGRASCRERV